METPDYPELARQLRQPEGEMGKSVAQRMQINNAPMYEAALPALGLQNGAHILEIGPANGAFLGDILGLAEAVQYTGADFSPTMVEQAKELNKAEIASGRANFHLCSAAEMPFRDSSFDRVLGINTIYFWGDASKELNEIIRVLKPGAKLVLGIRPAYIMRNLPFTQYGFRIYEKEELKAALEQNGFVNVRVEEHDEPNQQVNGESMRLSTVIATAEKPRI